jgi:hypothetical protein
MTLFMEEVLPEIKAAISRMMNAYERLAAAEERKADAMESLSASLKILLAGNMLPLSQNGDADGDAAMGEAEKPLNTMAREAVLDIILKMREEGATYGRIAEHLEGENIPTFSRKGNWHAQTIHRICRECAV